MEKEQQKAEKQNSSQKIPRGILITFVVIFVIAGMMGASAAVAQRAYADRIYGGISIAGIDVGGMTITEATESVVCDCGWSSTFSMAAAPLRIDGASSVVVNQATYADIALRV